MAPFSKFSGYLVKNLNQNPYPYSENDAGSFTFFSFFDLEDFLFFEDVVDFSTTTLESSNSSFSSIDSSVPVILVVVSSISSSSSLEAALFSYEDSSSIVRLF